MVGSNGLVYGTSAGNKTPFVGVYTTQLASRCRLLKPQRGTAFHVWLRAENKKKKNKTHTTACFKLISVMPSITMCKNQEALTSPRTPSRFPKSYFGVRSQNERMVVAVPHHLPPLIIGESWSVLAEKYPPVHTQSCIFSANITVQPLISGTDSFMATRNKYRQWWPQTFLFFLHFNPGIISVADSWGKFCDMKSNI